MSNGCELAESRPTNENEQHDMQLAHAAALCMTKLGVIGLGASHSVQWCMLFVLHVDVGVARGEMRGICVGALSM